MRKQPDRDDHHFLFNRQEWELRQEARDLRQNKTLIANIDRQVHNELHKACPAIPLLGQYALYRVRRDYEGVPGDPLTSMDRLMMTVETAAMHPKAHRFERQLARLAVQSIDIQRPFIKEGIVHGTLEHASVEIERASRSFEKESRYDPIWA